MSFWAVAQVCAQPPRRLRNAEPRSRVELRLAEAGFETYQPLTKLRVCGEIRMAELFPGYLFVRVIEQWYTIRWTQGVRGVLMSNGRPAHLHDRIVEDLRRNEVGGFVQLKKQPSIISGQSVRVLTGQFRGHLGLYEGQSSREREIVLLSLLGRMVRVELTQQDRIETA